MIVTVTNTVIHFSGAPLQLARELDARTAPSVKGHRYNRAFQQGMWDGREHMVKRDRDGSFTVPVGLLPDLLALADEWDMSLDVLDERTDATSLIETCWNPEWTLRGYQQEAVDAATTELDGWTGGKGLLRLPTRSGKTVIAAGIIDKLKVRTLFLVQSEMLLAQTIALFEKVLQVPIGKVGSGEWDIEGVTVASCQTLTRRAGKPEVEELIDGVDLVIFDECHHLEGKKWRELLSAIDARYKLGLSATIYFDLDGETPKGSIWMRAATGRVLYTMEPSDLIKMGYLIKPIIKLIPVRGEVEADDYPSAYQAGIIDHAERNRMVCDEALDATNKGLSTLVVASRLEHVAVLKEMLEERQLSVGVIVGATPADERRELVDGYNDGSVDILLGTVFGEGVDIPKIECVINAEGGQSKKATMQRFRNLTPADGKDSALFVDFMDFHSKWLAKHSKARLATYRDNPEFQITLVEGTDVNA